MTIPTPIDFLLSISLYEEFVITRDEDHLAVLEFMYQQGSYDTYCPECKRDSTFQLVVTDENKIQEIAHAKAVRLNRSRAGISMNPLPKLEQGLFIIQARCSRKGNHAQYFIFCLRENSSVREGGALAQEWRISKVGQKPSLADFHLSEVDGYKKALPEEQRKELVRALGLASHGIGVGAYVYLRRVFEFLIEDSHGRAKKSPAWDEAQEKAYREGKTSERVSLLREELPKFLVDNKEMYAYLSQGIHEWTEGKCLFHFDTLRLAIKLILDERCVQIERDATTKATSAAIKKISQRPDA